MMPLSPTPCCVRRIAPALLALGLGCACEPPPPEDLIPAECRDDTLIDVGSSTPAARRGQVKLIEIHHADGSATTTVVGAKFADFSLYTGSSQQGIELSPTCIGLTGQPVRSDMHCEYTTQTCEQNSDCAAGVDCRESDRLDVASVHIAGLAAGAIDLDQQGLGSFIKAGLASLYGSSTVGIQFTASNGAHPFVLNDGSLLDIPAPPAVEGVTPNLAGSTALEREDTFLRWSAGPDPDAAVFIDVIARQQFITDPSIERNVNVSCVALDDGCQTLWAGAVDWLVRPEPDWQMTDSVTVIVSRRTQMRVDLSADTPDTELTASLSSELHGSMRFQP
ncbi:MAG: hypothetical protein ABIJ09_15310 [Pseudomonadota bacterium]